MSKTEDMKTEVEALQVRIVEVEARVKEIAAHMSMMSVKLDELEREEPVKKKVRARREAELLLEWLKEKLEQK